MQEKNSYCSYCGSPFAAGASWPRHCQACHNTSYVNPLPVVVVLVPVDNGIVVIRRNIEPRKGTVTLPGGYIDVGETWQEAGAREVLEETGITINSDEIRLFDVMNGLDGTIVVFGLAAPLAGDDPKPFSSEETQEVSLIREPTELGFEMHTKVVARYFEAKGTGQEADPGIADVQ